MGQVAVGITLTIALIFHSSFSARFLLQNQDSDVSRGDVARVRSRNVQETVLQDAAPTGAVPVVLALQYDGLLVLLVLDVRLVSGNVNEGTFSLSYDGEIFQR